MRTARYNRHRFIQGMKTDETFGVTSYKIIDGVPYIKMSRKQIREAVKPNIPTEVIYIKDDKVIKTTITPICYCNKRFTWECGNLMIDSILSVGMYK